MRKTTILVLILSLLLLGQVGNVNAGTLKDNALLSQKKVMDKEVLSFKLDSNAKYKPGEVIVKYKDSVPSDKLSKKLSTYKTAEVGKVDTPNTSVISIPKGKNIEQFINELMKDPDIEFAQPNYAYHSFSNPSDTDYGKQWYLPKINTTLGWDKLPAGATDVTVAVIDNGVDVNHPDLKGNMLADNYNAVQPEAIIDPLKTDGHGTIVAGIIGAMVNNEMGIAGVSPKVKLLPINVFTGKVAYEEDIVNGIIHAVESNAKVINLSLGTYSYGILLKSAIDYAYENGVVVVAAAGNDNTDIPTYPASYANVISVGATTESDGKASFSNYGSTVDIVAPGTNIYSTFSRDAYGKARYASAQGTSMASPIVAGTAALLLAKNPTLSVDDVTNILLKSAKDIGAKGVDNTFGYGRVDVNNALTIGNTYSNDQWESNNSFTEAKQVSLGASVQASISKPGDTDFFKVTLTKLQRVRFRVTPQLNEDIKLEVYNGSKTKIVKVDQDGQEIGDQYYEGGIEEFNLTLNAGTYYLKVSDPYNSVQFRSYTLSTYYPVYNRLAGKDRYETAIKISQKGWANADTVVIANYKGYADALAGVPLAYQKNAPILLTDPKILTPSTKTEIQRLKAKNIVIVGGTGSISSQVENELKSMKLSVTRLGGKDRFETAKLIALKMNKTDTVIVTFGLNFPDALSIAPYAAMQGYPILLVTKDQIPDFTKQALGSLKSTHTIIIGGTGVISDNVKKQLPNPYRVSGQDRFLTAAEVTRKLNAPTEKVYVASGMGFADALAGAVLAAKDNSPLLLTKPNELPKGTRDIWLEKNVLNFTVLGGTGSVNNQVLTELLK
ncbi:cell wall-binding repeat-containing protein [Tepidibacillus marianensis]|uniref:cell wall-binding repeat-containing protein n=1 Tax=Tepidibacillus marianensis TaxID=3131995 RepID=UPI0030CFD7B9